MNDIDWSKPDKMTSHNPFYSGIEFFVKAFLLYIKENGIEGVLEVINQEQKNEENTEKPKMNNELDDMFCCCAQSRENFMRPVITDEEKQKSANDPVIKTISEQIQKHWNESIKRDLLITQLSTSLLVDIRNMADVLSIDFQDITFEKTNCGTLEELYSIMTEYFKIKDRFDKYDKEMAEMSKPTLQM